jgi:transcriptional regulator with XRE-family HTH domain
MRSWLLSATSAREALGLSQRQVARNLGLLQSFVSGVETGNSFRGSSVSTATVEKLRTMALVLDHPLPEEYATDEGLAGIDRPAKRTYTARNAKKPRRTRQKHLPPGTRVGVALVSLVATLESEGKLAPDVARRLLDLAAMK